MSKQWFYEIMGSTIGPITAAELKHKVELGQILPETRVRMGVDGKWQTADRIKGLLDPAPAPVESRPVPKPAAKESDPGRPAVSKGTPAKSIPLATSESASSRTAAPPAAPAPEIKIQMVGSAPEHHEPGDESNAEYDFFQFVGFEEALGTRLHQAFVAYCSGQKLTMTQATRRAIAKLIDRPELSGEAPPPAVSAEAAPEVPSSIS
jgi:hypothetical protein